MRLYRVSIRQRKPTDSGPFEIDRTRMSGLYVRAENAESARRAGLNHFRNSTLPEDSLRLLPDDIAQSIRESQADVHTADVYAVCNVVSVANGPVIEA